jgi:hypothetical protein
MASNQAAGGADIDFYVCATHSVAAKESQTQRAGRPLNSLTELVREAPSAAPNPARANPHKPHKTANILYLIFARQIGRSSLSRA